MAGGGSSAAYELRGRNRFSTEGIPLESRLQRLHRPKGFSGAGFGVVGPDRLDWTQRLPAARSKGGGALKLASSFVVRFLGFQILQQPLERLPVRVVVLPIREVAAKRQKIFPETAPYPHPVAIHRIWRTHRG